jgi:hypothetical protein
MMVSVAVLEKMKRRLFYTATALACTPGGKAIAENGLATHLVLMPPRERAA